MLADKCKYYDFCKREGVLKTDNGTPYCLLHYPDPTKNNEQFDASVGKYLASGRADFRHVHFLANYNPPFRDVTFPATVDFSHCILPRGLNLSGCTCPFGLIVDVETCNRFELTSVTLHGVTTFKAIDCNNGIVMRNGKVHGDLNLLIHEFCGHIELDAIFNGNLFCQGKFESIKTHRSSFTNKVQIIGSVLKQGIDLKEANFQDSSELDLEDTVCNGDLTLTGFPHLPQKINLAGTRIEGATVIEADLGSPRPLILAEKKRPHFRDTVRFVNTDLSSCLLVGNDLTDCTFTNVNWPKRSGRRVVWDELALIRNGSARKTFQGPLIGSIKEAYQVLKEKYEKAGDKAASAEFHYGEMEMQRREHGFWRRIISLEFLYWLLSGYGIGYVRAASWLVFLVLVCGELFRTLDYESFHTMSDALRFSFENATFQRPDIPEKLSTTGKWLRAVEAIAGPLQAALFGLALRMRFKR